MAMEVITPVSAVEHNTLFPRYDDGQQPEWYESEMYTSGQCAFGWVNEDAYGADGADGADGFGCTDDEYFASRASEARWLEAQQIIRNAQYAAPTTPTPTPAQNECSCCPDSLVGLHPDFDFNSEIVSPEEYALVQSHRAASEATGCCYEGCMCDKDCISYGPGPWFHSTVSLDEYELIQAYRLQQTHHVTAFPQEPQQQSGCNEDADGDEDGDEDDNEAEPMLHWGDEAEPMLHWGSMGDRLGGDDLSGVNLATPSWVNKTSSFPFLINEDNKENEGEVMWSSSSSKCNTTFRETPGGAGAVGLDNADCADYNADVTSALLTSPNSNPLGVHIVHERLTDYLDDDYDLTVYSDGEGDGDGDDYSYVAAARAGRQEYSDDDNFCCDNEGFNRDDAYKADPYW